MTFYFYPRQIRAAMRQIRAAVALLAKPASFTEGRYCVTDGCDPVYFGSLAAAMAWADWLSADPHSAQCEIDVIDTSYGDQTGRIRQLETGSPTWYRLNSRAEWELNLSDPDVADAYYDPSHHYCM
jgi:hypothetical protein